MTGKVNNLRTGGLQQQMQQKMSNVSSPQPYADFLGVGAAAQGRLRHSPGGGRYTRIHVRKHMYMYIYMLTYTYT